MKISVICPTRKRKGFLCTGIDSLIKFLSANANVEFLFRFDEDDVSTLEDVMKYYETVETDSTSITNKFKWGESTFKVSETMSKKHNVTMKFLVGHRHRYYYLNRYIDELMYVSDGEYAVNWTDDLELMTNDNYEGWDSLIEEGAGQHYIFKFRNNSHIGKPLFPVVVPRKFFEINGRLCPNVLDDQWWDELCKLLSPGVRVNLHWGVYHHCQFNEYAWAHEMDSTCKEGRLAWVKDRESKVKDDYDYYKITDMLKIKEYMDEHPNFKKTTQYHDTNISGKELEFSGPSGRWSAVERGAGPDTYVCSLCKRPWN